MLPKGAFSDEDLDWLGTAPAFTATGLQPDPGQHDSADTPRFVGAGLGALSTTPASEADKAAEVPRWSFLIGRNARGEVYRVWTYGFEFGVGDAQYFHPGDARRIRLRPLLSSDRRPSAGLLSPALPWADTDANSLLVVDSPDGAATLVFLVTLIPRGDPDVPATVERAIEYAQREYGAACPAEMMLLG